MPRDMTPASSANPPPYRGHDELIVEVDANAAPLLPWREIHRFRELFFLLAWRDFTVRYKQTLVGFAWAVIQPVIQMGVFTVVFGLIAGLEDSTPVTILAALLPWQLFRQALQNASMSITKNTPLVAKAYTPRVFLPASSIIVTLIDFAIGVVLLMVVMALSGSEFTLRLPLLFVIIIPALLLALGASLFISSMNVYYRDFKFLLPFLTKMGAWITPIGFTSERVLENTRIPDAIAFLFFLNPLLSVIDGCRWAVNGTTKVYPINIAIAIVVAVILITYGLRYFARAQRGFADYI